MSLLHRTALAAALLAAAPLASAATQADFDVTITITNACDISATDLAFPDSSSLDNDITATSTVSVECSNQGAFAVSFNKGSATAATLTDRQMRDSNGNVITYSLYRDAGHTELLGDGSSGSGSVTITDTSTGSVQTYDVYGLVRGGQGPKPTGKYADVVTATVSF